MENANVKSETPSAMLTADAAKLQQEISSMTADLKNAYKEKQRVEELALYYQRKLSTIVSKRKLSSADSADHTVAGEPITSNSAKRRRSSDSRTDALAKLRADLESSKAKVHSLTQEKRLLDERLENRDRSIASDAKELQQLRLENAQLHDLQIRLKAAEAEQKAAEMRAQRQTLENTVKLSMGEENAKFLQGEVKRLSEELTKSRFTADAAAASHSSTMRAVNELNKKLTDELAEAKSKVHRMEDYVRKVEADVSNTKSAGDREKQDYEEEKGRLVKLVEMHKELAKEAEQRVRDYEEIVQTLKEEVEKRESVPTQKGKIAAHAEVLLKNLQDALDARLHLLHQQKEEMERARASEMNMIAKQEALAREAEDAKWETEQVRKEMTRLRSQIREQSRRIVQLEKQLEITDAEPPQDPTREVFANRESFGRDSGMFDTDIGPLSEIPTHQLLATPGSLDEVDAAVQELAEIRMRHQRILMAMRERRAAYS